MKSMFRIVPSLAILLAIGLLAGCSFTLNGNQGKARVFVGAPQAGSAASRALAAATASLRAAGVPKSALKHSAIPAASRSAMQARDLSASTDIASISFRVSNLDPYSGEDDFEDYLDPTYPWIDLWLTPGESYRIVVSVTPTAAAPGSSVGVKMYGDQQDFTVDPDGYDTYVDLFVHPTSTLVFDPYTSTMGPSTEVIPFDPDLGDFASPVQFISSPPAQQTADKFFYGPTGLLYYFNYQSNKVYQWLDMATPIDAVNDVVISGSSLIAGGTQIYAVCADPTAPGILWLAGKTSGGIVQYFRRDVNAVEAPWDSVDLVTDFEDGNTGATIWLTGIAVDPWYKDVFVSFVNFVVSTGPAHSGFFEYWGNSVQIYVAETLTGPSSRAYVDVAYNGGHLWSLTAPYSSVGWFPGASWVGTADLIRWDLDRYAVIYQGSTSPVSVSSNGTLAGTADTLVQPLKFLGVFQGSTVYIGQRDFGNGGGSARFTGIDLDTWSVYDLPWPPAV